VTLPEERVVRELPTLRSPDDAGLFAAERERTFPPVSTRLVKGEFHPDGWSTDLGGWKGEVKRWLVRAATRRELFVPTLGRSALVATDRLSNGYFHWVTETLPRLWWLRDELSRFELLLPFFAQRFPYMAESLAVFPELTFRVLDPQVRWRVTEATLVPATAPGGNYRPQLLRGMAETWRQRSGAGPAHRKLYISRSKAARRRIANEAEVRGALESQGFETVHLEGMPFLDQVRLLAEARHVISNHGAGLTNTMFMVPGTKVTEIRLRGDAHNNCYFSLARALDLDYDYRLADPVQTGADAHTADVVVDAKGLL